MGPKHLYPFISFFLTVSFNPASSGKSATQVAGDLWKRYKDKTGACYNSQGIEKQAYQCSGIMIRGVSNKRNRRYAWSMKPFNIEKKSFAMAFLRQDAQWSGLPYGYEAGFIMYPHLWTPFGKNAYKVFCAFPLDGWTDNRGGLHACGANRAAEGGESHHCQDQGIRTFDKWHEHFDRVGHRFSRNQCGFDMTLKSSPAEFRTFLKATQFLDSYRFYGKYKFKDPNNEILVHSWNENNPKALPIEAFFYVMGTKGKYYAKKYQRQFELASGGERVPIVGIQFPDRAKKRPFKVTPW